MQIFRLCERWPPLALIAMFAKISPIYQNSSRLEKGEISVAFELSEFMLHIARAGIASHIHTYIHADGWTNAHAQACTYTHTCTCTRMCTHVRTHMHMYVHMCSL